MATRLATGQGGSLPALAFRSRGRLSRAGYWLALAVLAVATAVLGVAGWYLGGLVAAPVRIVLLGIVIVATAASCISIEGRRLNDRGRSGDLILVYWLAPVTLAIAAIVLGLGSALNEYLPGVSLARYLPGYSVDLANSTEITALAIAGIAVTIRLWVLVDLGLLRGTRGPNRHGPDPLAPGH